MSNNPRSPAFSETSLDLALNLAKDFANAYIQTYADSFSKSCSLSSGFYELYKTEKGKLPYHLNVIDELHANENAHSRILVKLLNYKRDNNYPFLISFLEYLNKNIPNFEFDLSQIEAPEVLNEAMRIDASIIEKDYAIIIENKIHGAGDQDNQINRYHAIVQDKQIDKIFVIYLTASGYSPSEDSLSKEIKNDLVSSKHYAEISYQHHILPWLKTLLPLPDVVKNEIMHSALLQYIDHLNGMFYQSNSIMEMKEKLQQTLKANLKLGEDHEQNIQTILDNIEKITETQKYLTLLKADELYHFCKSKIEKECSESEFAIGNRSGYRHLGKKIEIPNYGKCSVLLEFLPSGEYIFGVSSLYTEHAKCQDNIKEFLKDCYVSRSKSYSNSEWYFYSYVTDPFNLMVHFENQVKHIMDKINNN